MFIGMRVCPLRYEIEAGERLASARYAGHKTDSLALVPLGRFDGLFDAVLAVKGLGGLNNRRGRLVSARCPGIKGENGLRWQSGDDGTNTLAKVRRVALEGLCNAVRVPVQSAG